MTHLPLSLLEDRTSSVSPSLDHENIKHKLARLFREFSLPVTFHNLQEGPSITRYNYTASPNINLNKLNDIEANISLYLAVPSIRVLAPVPSKPFIGIEVPNTERQYVSMLEILQGKNSDIGKNMELPIILGKNITGKIIIADLARLPHLLIAGATGAGKSICVNSIITSLLFLRDNVNFVMVDPKIVELKVYDGIPQLLTNVITSPADAIIALDSLTRIMHERYKLLEKARVRNLASYNKVSDKPLSYIVCIIDEFADLVAIHRKELETYLATLSAMARATGIHLVLATQRPSVDVIIGVIKANFPSRIAFRVPSGIDSRVILDTSGAELLLGKGDMLYREPQYDHPERIQGIFISDIEVHNILSYLTRDGITQYEPFTPNIGQTDNIDNELLVRAKEVLGQTNNRTTSFLQRNLIISWDTASKIMEHIQTACPELLQGK